MHRNAAWEVGFEVMVGGGLGRTPFIGKTIRDFLPKQDLLSYLEAILRVYNEFGRRDNLYKARIKILVHEIGIETMREKVEAERSEEHTSELQSLMRISYAVFCLKKKNTSAQHIAHNTRNNHPITIINAQ